MKSGKIKTLQIDNVPNCSKESLSADRLANSGLERSQSLARTFFGLELEAGLGGRIFKRCCNVICRMR